MKGKYANAAEKRRVQEALERRVADAERSCEKAQAALTSERESAAREIARLKELLRTVTAERDAGEGPEVAKLEAISRELREQLDAERAYRKDSQRVWDNVVRGFFNYLTRVNGLTVNEAQEVVFNMLPDHPSRTDPAKVSYILSDSTRRSSSPETARRIEVARGLRHPNNVIREVAEAAVRAARED